jgi:hypothetical protein
MAFNYVNKQQHGASFCMKYHVKRYEVSEQNCLVINTVEQKLTTCNCFENTLALIAWHLRGFIHLELNELSFMIDRHAWRVELLLTIFLIYADVWIRNVPRITCLYVSHQISLRSSNKGCWRCLTLFVRLKPPTDQSASLI